MKWLVSKWHGIGMKYNSISWIGKNELEWIQHGIWMWIWL